MSKTLPEDRDRAGQDLSPARTDFPSTSMSANRLLIGMNMVFKGFKCGFEYGFRYGFRCDFDIVE